MTARLRLALIDYDAGNLLSIATALGRAGAEVTVVRSPQDEMSWDALVLPGVGAFAPAMARLERAGLAAWVRARAAAGTPLIGVCLGMQLLYERSEEGDPVAGLSLLPGEVRRLPEGLKVPHMGWNQLRATRPAPLLEGVPAGAFVYFVHSYVVAPAAWDDVVATTEYGLEFPSVVTRGRIAGLQFHPEKSGAPGRRILGNLVAWIADGAALPATPSC